MSPSDSIPAAPSGGKQRALHARLLALSTSELAPPHVDPRVAALAALGLVDFAHSPEGKARFSELASLEGFDMAKLDELQTLGDALLGVVDSFDSAERNPRPIAIPQDLEVECRARRNALTTLVGDKLGTVPSIARTLKQIKLGYGPVDLANDLRMLAQIVDHHGDELARGDATFDRGIVASTRALARSIEDLLHGADTPQLQQARSALHRVWHLFEKAYRDVAATGRELFSDHADAIFPTLEAIADVERTARHQSSSRMPASSLVDKVIPPSRRAGAASRRPSSRHMHAIRPPEPGSPPLEVDVLLNATSESNLWLGFSQDIAEGGVFIATYESRPIGARVEMAVRLTEDGPTIPLAGNIHWVRPPSAGDDFPAGLGVRFTDISADVARQLEACAAKRSPIFYDD